MLKLELLVLYFPLKVFITKVSLKLIIIKIIGSMRVSYSY